MRAILQNLFVILLTVFLTSSLAMPHICLDNNIAASKIEQTKIEKAATDTHQSNSKTDNHSCVAHHCCVAKLTGPVQPVWKAAFVSKAVLSVADQHYLAGLGPTSLDRPPKFFA